MLDPRLPVVLPGAHLVLHVSLLGPEVLLHLDHVAHLDHWFQQEWVLLGKLVQLALH